MDVAVLQFMYLIMKKLSTFDDRVLLVPVTVCCRIVIWTWPFCNLCT